MQKITFLFLLLFSVLYSCSPYKNIEKMQHMSDLKYPYDVKFQKLANDVKLAYIDEGKGEQTIIFIHGLGSYLPAWNKNVEALKSDYRCIAIDLPGYGKSSKNPHSGLMSFYAEVVKQFIDSLGIKNPILAGHSMGGQISMVAALQYPEKIGKLILVDPAGFERFNEGQKEWFKGVMTLDAVKKTTADGILTNLAYNFYKLPKEVFYWKNVQKLDLSYNQLTDIPEESKGWNNLQDLNLMSNQLITLPLEVSGWKNLQVLNVMKNKLEALPKEIIAWEFLRILYLAANPLNVLPIEVTAWKGLQKLHLSNNQRNLLTSHDVTSNIEIGWQDYIETFSKKENKSLFKRLFP